MLLRSRFLLASTVDRVLCFRSIGQRLLFRRFSVSSIVTPLLRERHIRNNMAYLQVLGSETCDTNPSLLLFFDNTRYMFNCGEGTQRFCTEHKIKMNKVHNIFFTDVTAATVGGLPGMLLTLADMGATDVHLHGPSQLMAFMNGTRGFVRRPNIRIKINSEVWAQKAWDKPRVTEIAAAALAATETVDAIGEQRAKKVYNSPPKEGVRTAISFEDELLKVDFITLSPPAENRPTKKSRSTSSSSSSSSSSNSKKEEVTCYLGKLQGTRGKFDIKKALALGMKPGPHFAALSNGQTITTETGLVVTPEQVMGPATPGAVFAIITCPSTDYVPSLQSNEAFKVHQYQGGTAAAAGGTAGVSCILHIAPLAVVNDETYKAWMQSFGKNTHHVFMTNGLCTDNHVFRGSLLVALKLNKLCSNTFPCPQPWPLTGPQASLSAVCSLAKEKVTPGHSLLKFLLSPPNRVGFDTSQLIGQMNEAMLQTEMRTTGIEAKVQEYARDYTQYKQQVKEALQEFTSSSSTSTETSAGLSSSAAMEFVLEQSKNCPMIVKLALEADATTPELVTLGTGSALPSKYRNVTANYLHIPAGHRLMKTRRGEGETTSVQPAAEDTGLLLDCGEDTVGQLTRRYGVLGAESRIRGLGCVWISHMHADHHLGLIALLNWHSKLTAALEGVEPLLVVGPPQLNRWLMQYSRASTDSIHFRFLPCSSLLPPQLPSDDAPSSSCSSSSSFFSSSSGCSMDEYMACDEQGEGPAPVPPVKFVLDNDFFLSTFGFTSFFNVPVIHCPNSYGLILEHEMGWKFVYSGDTRPCDLLVNAGFDATLLLHEATLENGMELHAVEKRHCTTGEALQVGVSMRAQRTCLTHFSQRFPKIPTFALQTDRSNSADLSRILIAFDLMSMKFNQLLYIPFLIPSLPIVFPDEMEAENERGIDD